MVINEFTKTSLNTGKEPNLTFWRDSTGNKVELLLSTKGKQQAYEIKSGATYSSDYFKGIKIWAKLSETPSEHCFAIYNGDRRLSTSHGEVIPWNET